MNPEKNYAGLVTLILVVIVLLGGILAYHILTTSTVKYKPVVHHDPCNWSKNVTSLTPWTVQVSISKDGTPSCVSWQDDSASDP